MYPKQQNITTTKTEIYIIKNNNHHCHRRQRKRGQRNCEYLLVVVVGIIILLINCFGLTCAKFIRQSYDIKNSGDNNRNNDGDSDDVGGGGGGGGSGGNSVKNNYNSYDYQDESILYPPPSLTSEYWSSVLKRVTFRSGREHGHGSSGGSSGGGNSSGDKGGNSNNNSNESNGEEHFDGCLLGTAESYLAWWINYNGSLNVPDDMNDKYHLDLSFTPQNSYTIQRSVQNSRTGRGFDDEDNSQNEDDEPLISMMSIAHTNLTHVPSEALELISSTLEFLSLKGNNFSGSIVDEISTGQPEENWAQFPFLPNLRELDLRSCQICVIKTATFENLPGLQRLYMAHNRFNYITSDAFNSVPKLFHLDLSYNNIQSLDEPTSSSMTESTEAKFDPFSVIQEGLYFPDTMFANMENLMFLDMSYTKIQQISAKTFSTLPPNIQMLSLCYTWLPMLPGNMFKGTQLRVLDLSGNPNLSYNLHPNSLSGLSNSLEILSVTNSNIKPMNWLTKLRSVRILLLSENNFNQLTTETFRDLKSLEMLDLSNNHLGNWYTQMFSRNKKLKFLKLHNNNINLITTEMFRDFQELDYLALGGNNFICSCNLREFIDVAITNSRQVEYIVTERQRPNLTLTIVDQILETYRPALVQLAEQEKELDAGLFAYAISRQYDIPLILYESNREQIEQSYKEISTIKAQNFHYNLRLFEKIQITKPPVYEISPYDNNLESPSLNNNIIFVINDDDDDKNGDDNENENNNKLEINNRRRQPHKPTNVIKIIDNETFTFAFQLLDFNENAYQCINSTTNEVFCLTDIDNCKLDRSIDFLEDSIPPFSFLTIVWIIIGFLCLIGIYLIFYYKWWYIRFFFISIRNTWILSTINGNNNKDHKTKLLNSKKMRKTSGTNVDNEDDDEPFNYDVFVSYCDENRNWILDEFIPNIEKCRNIKVCLHERDFQVGLSILENIIYCMDRSRCILLIISENFLLSQWCQFEMHLAQHRLLETGRDQLILILLEDIPKRKRSQTLHYLMKTKTYIKWPIQTNNNDTGESTTTTTTSSKATNLELEANKLFWRRLKRALDDGNDWENDHHHVHVIEPNAV